MVVSELAKRRTKLPSPKGSILNKALVAGVLASVLSYGITNPANAAVTFDDGQFSLGSAELLILRQIAINHGMPSTAGINWVTGVESPSLYVDMNGNTRVVATWNKVPSSGSSEYVEPETVSWTLSNAELNQLGINLSALKGGNTYTAGNGLALNGTTFSAKAGTNVTVNANGISVTGNGTVASGNTGLIDGGKLYSEVRPSGNGNYVNLNCKI